MEFRWVLLVAFCAFLGAVAQVFFKLASSDDFSSLLVDWKLYLGLFLYGVAMVFFLIALRFGSLSVLYPVIATSYVWVSFFSVIFLHESFPWYKWVGVLLIVFSVGLIVR